MIATHAETTLPVARLEQRLAELRSDLAAGEQALRELDARREQLVATLMRVSGAVQVLEELATAAASPPGGTD